MARQTNRFYLIISPLEMPAWWKPGQGLFIKDLQKERYLIQARDDESSKSRGRVKVLANLQCKSVIILPGYYRVLPTDGQAVILEMDKSLAKYSPDEDFTFMNADQPTREELKKIDPYNCEPYELARWLRGQLVEYIIDGKIPQGLASTAALMLETAKVAKDQGDTPKLDFAGELRRILNDPNMTGPSRIGALKELSKIVDPKNKEPRQRVKIIINEKEKRSK